MVYNHYEIQFSNQVAETLKLTKDYVFEKSQSETIAQTYIEKLVKGIEILKLFPEAGFNADEKFGKMITQGKVTRGITLKKDYIALYDYDEFNLIVYVRYLIPTKSDYMTLFK